MVQLLGTGVGDVYALIIAEGSRYGIEITAVPAVSPEAFSIEIAVQASASEIAVSGPVARRIAEEIKKTFFKNPPPVKSCAEKASLIIKFKEGEFRQLFSSSRGRIAVAVALVAQLRKINLN